MRMNQFGAGVGIAALCVASGVASGDIVPVGDPQDGNSWSQRFRVPGEPALGSVFIGMEMVSAGDTFEDQVIFDFNRAGWGQIGDFGDTPTLAAAAGPTPLDVGARFSVRFAGPRSNDLTFRFHTFEGSDETLTSVQVAEWTGSWSITRFTLDDGNLPGDALTADDFRAAVIPLPAGPAMGAVGLLAVFGIRKRLR